MKIKDIRALEVLDSRGNPTVSATIVLADGSVGSAMVPSGASTGSYEAVELRDNDKTIYGGLGVKQAIKNIIENIKPVLIDQEAEEQFAIDDIMIKLDGTPNKANLGANAILAVSLAVARASANSAKLPLYKYLTKFNPDFVDHYYLPVPMMNVLNGGKHANWATDIQEYMILPIGAKNMEEAVRFCVEIYQNLKKILKAKNYSISVGDEGGFAPLVSSNEEAFILLSEAVKTSGYVLGRDIIFGIDAAATEFFADGLYNLKKENKSLSGKELSGFYTELLEKYPIHSFEDIFAEDDWLSFKEFTSTYGQRAQIVGDDLYVTNVERLKKGIQDKSTNSILIKLNQIGTLSETVAAILLARASNMTSVISHRSGETEDSFIADLSVAMGTGQIKTGAPARSERTAKYNRLLEIAAELKDQASYAVFPFKVK